VPRSPGGTPDVGAVGFVCHAPHRLDTHITRVNELIAKEIDAELSAILDVTPQVR
jgi:hypothetical protein